MFIVNIATGSSLSVSWGSYETNTHSTILPGRPGYNTSQACGRQEGAYSGGSHIGWQVSLYTIFLLFGAQGDPDLYLTLENEGHMVVPWVPQSW